MYPFAMFQQDVPPTIAMVIMFLIPIVAILARHQQKMALIIRRPIEANSSDSVAQLTAEVRELRAQLNQQTLILDGISETNRRLAAQLDQRISV
jgi:hypothetical protein